jgi:hypothetical protein
LFTTDTPVFTGMLSDTKYTTPYLLHLFTQQDAWPTPAPDNLPAIVVHPTAILPPQEWDDGDTISPRPAPFLFRRP